MTENPRQRGGVGGSRKVRPLSEGDGGLILISRCGRAQKVGKSLYIYIYIGGARNLDACGRGVRGPPPFLGPRFALVVTVVDQAVMRGLVAGASP